MLQAALNGSRTRAEHAALPLSPADLAREARDAVAAGARSLHVHPRDAAGAESLAAPDVHAAVDAIHAACPGVPVGVSTGAWMEPSPERRFALVSAWSGVDFASVNFDEPGAEAVAWALLAAGIGVEAGLASADAASRFAAFDGAERCLRVLIEPAAPTVKAARATVRAVEGVLDSGQIALPRLLHGFDATAWALVGDAGAAGYAVRIGFEDTLRLPDGSLAASNAALVRAARRRLGARSPYPLS